MPKKGRAFICARGAKPQKGGTRDATLVGAKMQREEAVTSRGAPLGTKRARDHRLVGRGEGEEATRARWREWQAACRARMKARSNSVTPSDDEWWYFRPEEEVGKLPVDLILPHAGFDMQRAVALDGRKPSATSHLGKALKAESVVLHPGDKELIMDYLADRDDVFEGDDENEDELREEDIVEPQRGLGDLFLRVLLQPAL